MNRRVSDSDAAPAVYKAMLARRASVDKSGLEKDLMDLVCLRTSFQIADRPCSIHIWTQRRLLETNRHNIFSIIGRRWSIEKGNDGDTSGRKCTWKAHLRALLRFRTTRIAWLYKLRKGEHQCTHG